MKRSIFPFVLAALLVLSPLAMARGQSNNYCTTCERDSNGHIKRSQSAKNEFKKEHPCPSTGKSKGACPGYVIDHIQPLKRGGEDAPRNMQWQTKEDAKKKDRTE
jgi:hypothetical protein